MKRIFVLFISAIIFSIGANAAENDTVKVKKSIITGIELIGPAMGFIDSDNINYEAYISYRKNLKYYLTAEFAYSDFHYEQYNYTYNNTGFSLRFGTDINLLKPEMSTGNNFVGIGIKYGLSVFSQNTPWLKYDNYWGSTEALLEGSTATGHYIQLSGGVKSELIKNVLIGWSLKANLLLFHTAGKDNKPAYIPGMGITDKRISPGVCFHIAWILPLSKN